VIVDYCRAFFRRSNTRRTRRA